MANLSVYLLKNRSLRSSRGSQEYWGPVGKSSSSLLLQDFIRERYVQLGIPGTLKAVVVERGTVKGPFQVGLNWDVGLPSFQDLMSILLPGGY